MTGHRRGALRWSACRNYWGSIGGAFGSGPNCRARAARLCLSEALGPLPTCADGSIGLTPKSLPMCHTVRASTGVRWHVLHPDWRWERSHTSALPQAFLNRLRKGSSGAMCASARPSCEALPSLSRRNGAQMGAGGALGEARTAGVSTMMPGWRRGSCACAWGQRELKARAGITPFARAGFQRTAVGKPCQAQVLCAPRGMFVKGGFQKCGGPLDDPSVDSPLDDPARRKTEVTRDSTLEQPPGRRIQVLHVML